MDDQSEKISVCLAHDWLVGMRGGEWVLDRLARLFGPTSLYTLVHDGRFHTQAIEDCRIVTSQLQRYPGANGRLRRIYLPLMPRAVEGLKVDDCDLLISTSSAVMKSIQTSSSTRHMCYCHSPARYVWGQTEEYKQGAGGVLRGLGLRMIKKRFQNWDRETAGRVDCFLANSTHTARRIRACYERDAIVVHPPVRTERFTPDGSISREDWYLVVAALEPYKRTRLVIEAANQEEFQLKVAGGGTQFRTLQALAGPTVQMLGRVDEDELLALYRKAKALIFPQIEDFGIVAVEAQATGCPLVAFGQGGALDIVTEETGVFFAEHLVESILKALTELSQRMESSVVNAVACRRNAERFSEEVFDEAIRREAARVLSGEFETGGLESGGFESGGIRRIDRSGRSRSRGWND